MASFKCYWHCISFHLTGCPLHSFLSSCLKFSLYILDATPQLSPEPSGCAFSAVSLTLSTLKMVYRLYWIVTFTFKFLALKTLNTGPVYSPSWLAAPPTPCIPSRVLDSPCSRPFPRPPSATTLPRASRPTACSHEWFPHFHKAPCWLDRDNIVQTGVFLCLTAVSL